MSRFAQSCQIDIKQASGEYWSGSVTNRIAAYEDSIFHHYKMVKMAIYKDSIANLFIKESNGIKCKLKAESSVVN